MHSLAAGSAEQVTGAGSGFNDFTSAHTGEHFYQHYLFAQTGAVALQIVLKDFCDDALFKGLPLAGYQLGFLHLVDGEYKNQKYNDNKHRQAPSQKEMRPTERMQSILHTITYRRFTKVSATSISVEVAAVLGAMEEPVIILLPAANFTPSSAQPATAPASL